MAKRKIFDELMEGIAAMKRHREGEVTLRGRKVVTRTAVGSDALGNKRHKTPPKKHPNILQ